MTNSVVFIIHYCMYVTNTLIEILKNKHSIFKKKIKSRTLKSLRSEIV